MVQFTGFASYTYVFSVRWPKGPGFPIRKSRVTNACLSARPSLSQTTTSFIASNCLGIHHIRLFAWPYNLNDLGSGVLLRKLNVSHLLWSRDCSKLLDYHRIIRLKYTNSRPLIWLETGVSCLQRDLEFKKTNEDQFPLPRATLQSSVLKSHTTSARLN